MWDEQESAEKYKIKVPKIQNECGNLLMFPMTLWETGEFNGTVSLTRIIALFCLGTQKTPMPPNARKSPYTKHRFLTEIVTEPKKTAVTLRVTASGMR